MPSKLYKALLFSGILLILIAVPVFYFQQKSQAEEIYLEVNFLDVGQGDAVLIKTPFGQNILIDGGPDDSIVYRLGENLDWWDRRIDLIILTHPHDDHVAGLVNVLKRYQVEEIVYAGVVHTAPNYLEWLRLAKEKNIPVKLIEKPHQIILGPDCRFDIFYPHKSFFKKEVSNLNNTSIVAKLTYKERTFLFTGDMEKEAEEELLLNYSSSDYLDTNIFDSDVLKVAHHGSDTSSSQDFINLVKPEISVIMVGADNKFGHPANRILKRLEKAGSEIYRTDIHGSIKISSDGLELKVEVEK